MDSLDQQLKVGIDMLVWGQVNLGGGGTWRADVELATMSPCYRPDSFVLRSVLMPAEHGKRLYRGLKRRIGRKVHVR